MYNPTTYYDRRLLNLKNSAFLSSYRRMPLNDLALELAKVKGSDVTTDPSRWKEDNSNYSEIYKLWCECKFNPNSIKWINYYPGTHFDSNIVDDVAAYLRVKVHRSWISRVNPGYYAPWHWDVDDNEEEYLKTGEPKRYSIFMNNPTMGHVLIVGEDYLYNMPWGSIIRWKNYKEWHAASNAGLSPFFILHILGY